MAFQEHFQCRSGCVPASLRCDGVVDCASGDDEADCGGEKTTPASPCSEPDKFVCRGGGGLCIEAAYVCDGEADCADASDEADCPTDAHCSAISEFACRNRRQCVAAALRCDGRADCDDDSDEAPDLCAPNASASAAGDCHAADQFFCPQSRVCIPQLWVCDKVRRPRFATSSDRFVDGHRFIANRIRTAATARTKRTAPCPTLARPSI